MSVQSIYGATSSTPVNTAKVSEKKENTTNNSASAGFNETAVIYEKSSKTDDTVTNKNSTIDRDAVIAQMKADTEARMTQLTSLVKKMMSQQGQTIGVADDMWKFLAKGDFTVTADVKAQAQADIAEDGYWGVEQTSDRILDFAKALSGGDASKADELLKAFKKGYQEATGSWGKDLPEISKKTYDAVVEKFESWKNGESTNINA